MKKIGRREFIRNAAEVLAGSGLALFMASSVNSAIKGKPTPNPSQEGITHPCPSQEGNAASPKYDWTKHEYGYVIDITRCIGCGMCVRACNRIENNVPEPFVRTWVERYSFLKNDRVVVESPGGGIDGFNPLTFKPEQIDKSFFVPKLCNHCRNPRCVQVCPVGASFITREGVVLIDKKYCVGCGYCVQACPYAARYMHPVLKTADKCTWCYHRVKKGGLPACVLACSRKARMFGNINDQSSQVSTIIKTHQINELKPELKTHPRVHYVGLDKEVR